MIKITKLFISASIIGLFFFSACSSFSQKNTQMIDILDIDESSMQGQVDNEFVQKLYEQAKSLASDGKYLTASDMLLNIIKVSPKYEAASVLNERIAEKMYLISVKEKDLDISEISYAKGYVNYYSKRYDSAISEWKRYLQYNNFDEEVQEYIHKIEAMRMLDIGANSFNNKQYIDCIKQMGQLQDFIVKNHYFSSSLIYYDRAKTYIDRSIAALRSNISRLNATEQTVVAEASASAIRQSPNSNANNNIEEANKKYEEGLLYYSQGDYMRANRTWELALRLNPNLDKAKVAISNLRRNRVVDN
ncbi:MAG: hypothetical protein LBT79_01205 [Elusimicrobiota bacterium]|jgi:tetratricopeptide (TPR) repeat protein|nr:hypothetical protein [Elusimicrobiota bacterium]